MPGSCHGNIREIGVKTRLDWRSSATQARVAFENSTNCSLVLYFSALCQAPHAVVVTNPGTRTSAQTENSSAIASKSNKIISMDGILTPDWTWH
jgi:hypothetical protein